MLTPEARADVWKRVVAYDGDGAAIDAILAAAFYLKGLTPVVEQGTHTFEDGQKFDEYPGTLRGPTGWLMAPRYTSSLDDASDLVAQALGDGWIIEAMIRPDGSQVRLHQFNPPCAKTVLHGGGPGRRGAAMAVVRAVMQATDPEFQQG